MTADWQLTNALGAGDGIGTHDVLLGKLGSYGMTIDI